jgi:hypothetical protein
MPSPDANKCSLQQLDNGGEHFVFSQAGQSNFVFSCARGRAHEFLLRSQLGPSGVGSRPLNGGYIIFSRRSSYPTITRAIAAKGQLMIKVILNRGIPQMAESILFSGWLASLMLIVSVSLAGYWVVGHRRSKPKGNSPLPKLSKPGQQDRKAKNHGIEK